MRRSAEESRWPSRRSAPPGQAERRRSGLAARRSRPRRNCRRRKDGARARRRMARRDRAQRRRQGAQAAARDAKPRRASSRPDRGDRRGLALSLGSGPAPTRTAFSRCSKPIPKRISPALIAEVARAGRSPSDEAEVMRAPAARQGGGRAADRARRHRRRLAGRARHARAHRLRRRGDRRGGALPAARRRRAGQAQACAIRPRPEEGTGYVVLAMGKMGAFELNYSSDIDLIVLLRRRARRRSPTDVEPARALRPAHARPREAAAGAHRRRLRVPHRPAAAARSGLDPDRDLDARRRSTTTRASGRTGSAPR